MGRLGWIGGGQTAPRPASGLLRFAKEDEVVSLRRRRLAGPRLRIPSPTCHPTPPEGRKGRQELSAAGGERSHHPDGVPGAPSPEPRAKASRDQAKGRGLGAKPALLRPRPSRLRLHRSRSLGEGVCAWGVPPATGKRGGASQHEGHGPSGPPKSAPREAVQSAAGSEGRSSLYLNCNFRVQPGTGRGSYGEIWGSPPTGAPAWASAFPAQGPRGSRGSGGVARKSRGDQAARFYVFIITIVIIINNINIITEVFHVQS